LDVPEFRPLAQNLETARLRMRPWKMSDSAAVRELWTERDPRAIRVIDADGKPTVDDIRIGLENQLADTAKNGLALLALERKSDGEFIGYCGLIVGQATAEEPEIAYELFRRFHGQGYATEAARAVLSAALDTGRTRFWSTVRAWNTPSFRVLEKIGFINSGRTDVDPVRGDSVWMTFEVNSPELPGGPS
jgi:RimJ/RimL family protein N-acetyltransferase